MARMIGTIASIVLMLCTLALTINAVMAFTSFSGFGMAALWLVPMAIAAGVMSATDTPNPFEGARNG